MSQAQPQTFQLGSLQPGPQVSGPQVLTPQPQSQQQLIAQQQQQQQPHRRRTYDQPGPDLKRFNPPSYLGYRVFCKWAASDQTYFIVRKFPALNIRVILNLQDEIVRLEQELDELDEDWSRKTLLAGVNYPDPDLIHNGTFRKDDVQERKDLLEKLTKKLSYYNRYVNEYAQLARQPQAPSKDITNVESWFENHRTAIADEEMQYIKHREELISVQPKIRSWFRGILEMTHFLKIPCIKPWFTRKPYDYQVINDDQGYWQDDKRVEILSKLTIAIVGLGMLVGPLWWLNFVSSTEKQLGIITGFIALFFVLVAVATTASVAEALASAAAYSAVLMVFLQLGSGGGH